MRLQDSNSLHSCSHLISFLTAILDALILIRHRLPLQGQASQIHCATAVVYYMCFKLPWIKKATELLEVGCLLAIISTLGPSSTATKARPMPATDWPHKDHKRPRRCKLLKSSFLKNKSNTPGFSGSILSWCKKKTWNTWTK